MIDKKDKILLISWGVYPDQNGSSVIIHNLARTLTNKIVVVGELPETIKPWDVINYPLIHIETNILNLKRGIKYHKWLSFFRSFRRINQIIKQHNCTKIIAVFPDEYFLSLSYILAKFNGIQLYPWLHNTYVENRSGLFKLLAEFLQPKVFKYSTKIFCMSDGLTQYYANKYNDAKFNTLRHPFDINISEIEIAKTNSNGPFTFAYTGSLNESCRDASIRICKAISMKANCKLIVFGQRNLNDLINAGIPSEYMQSFGFLEKEVFDQQLKMCDFMILAHGFRGTLSDVEYDTIFPTRTVPLLYCGKPIVAHASATSFLGIWIKQNNCGYLISSEDQDKISSAIDVLIYDIELQKTLVSNAKKMSLLFDSNIVSNELLTLINYNQID